MAVVHARLSVHACLSGGGRYLLVRNRTWALTAPQTQEERMAGSVNKVILVGNLGADPEARSLNNGSEVVNLRIATSESWKDQSGQRQERTEWHRVVIFNENLGRVAKQYLRKGSKVYLEGQLQTRKWTNQQGQDQYSTEVVLQRFRGEMVLLDRSAEQTSELQSLMRTSYAVFCLQKQI